MWQFVGQSEDHRGEKPITSLFISWGAYGPDSVCAGFSWPRQQMGTHCSSAPASVPVHPFQRCLNWQHSHLAGTLYVVNRSQHTICEELGESTYRWWKGDSGMRSREKSKLLPHWQWVPDPGFRNWHMDEAYKISSIWCKAMKLLLMQCGGKRMGSLGAELLSAAILHFRHLCLFLFGSWDQGWPALSKCVNRVRVKSILR